MRIICVGVLFLFLGSISLQAQKYAYCNSGNLVEAIALKENTDQLLEAFQDPLIKQGQDMLNTLKENERKLYAEIEKGVLSQVAIQERQNLLIAETEKITKFEKEVANKIAVKRQELLEPILKKVQVAIDQVAKDGGYSMVFDESSYNAILFADPANDITPLVKGKLDL
ncbi:MAG: OmpH family outer membrane protein [Saprospiraceae bacterium]|nr:OmpH family outer membrane protein [Saprospiraceae bacterium]